MNIAEAFANRLADLVKSIDAAEFNPVRCCVCVCLHPRDDANRAETIIRGYAVCLNHVSIDEHLGLRDYIEAIEHAFKAGRAQ